MNIQYKRVLLRPIEASDLELLQALHNMPELGEQTVGWSLPVSMDAQQQWFLGIKNEKNAFRFMIENENQQAVGCGSLTHMDHHNGTVELHGVKILPAFGNAGYAQEAVLAVLKLAFELAGFYLIEVTNLSTQAITTHAMKKYGFVQEGIKRSRIRKMDERVDILMWSMTITEYREKIMPLMEQ